MPKGIEYLEEGDSQSRPLRLSEELHNEVISAAILEGVNESIIVGRAASWYLEHLRLKREGMDGPIYRLDEDRDSPVLQFILGPLTQSWRIVQPGEDPIIERP